MNNKLVEKSVSNIKKLSNMNTITLKLRIVLLALMGIIAINGANAQTDSSIQNANLEREKFRLAFDVSNSSVLEKEELKILLSDKQFSTYNHARRCYVASIPLLAGGACLATASGILLSIGLFRSYDQMVAPYVLFGYANLFGIIPGIILITHSAKKLNNIAEDYNNQRLSSYYQRNVQLNFGFTQNGIGFKLNF